MMFRWMAVGLCCLAACAQANEQVVFQQVKSLQVRTLSTMLANQGVGEWGYAALIEADGHKLLFDTGNRPETVLQNADELGIDLAEVEDVLLSHNHGDHTGGLLRLREVLKQRNPKALSRVHVGQGIFAERVGGGSRLDNLRKTLEADGVEFFQYTDVTELFPGVWLTGNVERIHAERNWSGNGRLLTDAGEVEDTIPEDLSVVVDTANGFVLISGCGHAGMINTMEQVRRKLHAGPISTAIGGFHLMSASDEHLAWTAGKLQEFGLTRMIGAHCTGIDSLYSLRKLMNSDRSHMVVGAVGDRFDLERGVQAAMIAR